MSPRIDSGGRLVALDGFPFVIDVLTRFTAPMADGGMGHRIGLISNTGTEPKAHLVSLLAAARLLPLFDAALLLFSSVEGLTKAETALFKLAATRAGVPPTRCLYVGEDPAERHVAAEAGMAVSFHPLHALHVVGTRQG